MDWATALHPVLDRSFNAFIVLVDMYRQIPMLLPCHKDATGIYKAIMIWNRVASHTGLFQNIPSDRDPKFTSALWTNLHTLFGTKLSFSIAYNPHTDGLAERMIQNLDVSLEVYFTYPNRPQLS
ncbi:hypothetical protein O181_021623 [Austropuccinia psidii MF-1]|uniref:Integrase catalytic domain-containing protein n=1 Tax=Austropuccinia psidii MF-1 TaxID=1389203 RepID=A0A9Q3CDP7_9BASI|nr:hypothetical protein [Austropuccinia psidii MF-1]